MKGFFVTKSLPDQFLILGIITSPIFVDPFRVVFTVLPSVISDVFLFFLLLLLEILSCMFCCLGAKQVSADFKDCFHFT